MRLTEQGTELILHITTVQFYAHNKSISKLFTLSSIFYTINFTTSAYKHSTRLLKTKNAPAGTTYSSSHSIKKYNNYRILVQSINDHQFKSSYVFLHRSHWKIRNMKATLKNIQHIYYMAQRYTIIFKINIGQSPLANQK